MLNPNKQYAVKRVQLNEYGQITEVEFFDALLYSPQDIADFIQAYNNRREEHAQKWHDENLKEVK